MIGKTVGKETKPVSTHWGGSTPESKEGSVGMRGWTGKLGAKPIPAEGGYVKKKVVKKSKVASSQGGDAQWALKAAYAAAKRVLTDKRKEIDSILAVAKKLGIKLG